LDGISRLDAALLERLGIAPADVAREQVAVLTYSATKLAEAGCTDLAAMHWRDAARIALRHPRRVELFAGVLRARVRRGGGTRLAKLRDVIPRRAPGGAARDGGPAG
jgi:hypothetical protein